MANSLMATKYTLREAFVRYHRGLGKMPLGWKPFLTCLLIANMIAPLFAMYRLECQVVFGVALLNGATFVVLTAYTGFSRLLGFGHIFWIPLIVFLALRLDKVPNDTNADVVHWVWMLVVICLNSVSLVFDVYNVIRYLRGDHEELVADL
jgi:hypothetical protein